MLLYHIDQAWRLGVPVHSPHGADVKPNEGVLHRGGDSLVDRLLARCRPFGVQRDLFGIVSVKLLYPALARRSYGDILE
jgi:hypothetical protein